MPTRTLSRFSGPYEVEEDLTSAEIQARRRPDKRIDYDTDVAYELAEVEHLAGYGVRDRNRIAEHLGITAEAYEKRLARTVGQIRGAGDRRCEDMLERLISEGRPFGVESLPVPDDPRLASTLLQRAHKAGRIRCVAVEPHTGTKVWQATNPAQ
ncbi:hypothetical protein [Rhodococcus opacus]|uniref:hypothetical protein n=1 Tax=Rhodococcus opacus TaxID=37919 RepID=UPI001C43ADC3|nr:hypothetical protein [Rhodococcus opacus]MBV6758400.1 hypothetical protein [Rhodococcus opacus]